MSQEETFRMEMNVNAITYTVLALYKWTIIFRRSEDTHELNNNDKIG
jgi:hypothetical protein